jgi:hypothetical protein
MQVHPNCQVVPSICRRDVDNVSSPDKLRVNRTEFSIQKDSGNYLDYIGLVSIKVLLAQWIQAFLAADSRHLLAADNKPLPP